MGDIELVFDGDVATLYAWLNHQYNLPLATQWEHEQTDLHNSDQTCDD
jgi:hypothetical protein